MKQVHRVSIGDVNEAARAAAKAIQAGQGVKRLYGVPRGGIPAAYAVAQYLIGSEVVSDPHAADFIIDDIFDSGATKRRYREKHPDTDFFVLFDKRTDKWQDKWLVMPWEESAVGDESAIDIPTRLLQFIGEDTTREGLKDTPKRFIKAWEEWASGYGQDPAEILKTFVDGSEGYNDMVIVHNIPVYSKCEHHLADIVGTAHVGYIPAGRVVGLSKLPRLVNVFARRLQVQERLTVQIADAIEKHLEPKGVAVVIRATHLCMSSRGVRIHGSTTTTSAMRGALMDETAARAEFLALCHAAETGIGK